MEQGWVHLEGCDDDLRPGELEGVGWVRAVVTPMEPHRPMLRLHAPGRVADDVDALGRQLAPDQRGAALDRP